eukprot:m.75687 g.75687  ORF g.75687 m.75687 type:complete len:644 (-) comp10431_c0_seq2:1396-3327(-)
MADSDDELFGDMGAVMAACEQAESVLAKGGDPKAASGADPMALDAPLAETSPSERGTKRDSADLETTGAVDERDDVTPDVGARPFDSAEAKRRRIDSEDKPPQPNFDQVEDTESVVPSESTATSPQAAPTVESDAMEVDPPSTAPAVPPFAQAAAPVAALEADPSKLAVADAMPPPAPSASAPVATEAAPTAAGPKKAGDKAATPCAKCQNEPGAVIAPTKGGKQYTLLCKGCAKAASFCEKCKGVCERGTKDELEKCKACGWMSCDASTGCPGACGTCDTQLRPLRTRFCKKEGCRQGWAEAGKFCTSCGSCGLKSCTAKFSTCRKDGCRVSALPNPCSRMGKQPPAAAKHYHCTDCIAKAAVATAACPHCKKTCVCDRCGTCNTGACCYGSAGPQKCKIKGCTADVCKRCAQKAKASGKFSGHCTKHHGLQRSAKVSGKALPNHGLNKSLPSTAAPPQEKKDKPRKCEGCSGTERPDRPRFSMVGGVFYCTACAPEEAEMEPEVPKDEAADAATGAQAISTEATPMDEDGGTKSLTSSSPSAAAEADPDAPDSPLPAPDAEMLGGAAGAEATPADAAPTQDSDEVATLETGSPELGGAGSPELAPETALTGPPEVATEQLVNDTPEVATEVLATPEVAAEA